MLQDLSLRMIRVGVIGLVALGITAYLLITSDEPALGQANVINISITGPANPVREGEDMVFTVTASSAPASPLTISYRDNGTPSGTAQYVLDYLESGTLAGLFSAETDQVLTDHAGRVRNTALA